MKVQKVQFIKDAMPETDFLFHIAVKNKSMTHPVHIHVDNLEMVYILEGARQYFVINKVINLEKGDLLFLNNKQIHQAKKNKPGKNCTYVNIHFDKSLIDNANIDRSFKPAGLFFNKDSKSAQKIRLAGENKVEAELLFKKMTGEFKKNTPVSRISIKLCMLQLLHLAAQASDTQLKTKAGGEEKQVSAEAERVVKEIIDYMDRNFTKELSLEHLSKQGILSPFYFSRTFHNVTGMNIPEYINRKRVLMAKDLLQNTDKTITDICFDVGYESNSYFNYIFKKLAGVSPLKYRKLSGKKL